MGLVPDIIMVWYNSLGGGTERKTDDTELGWHTDFAYSDFKECRGGRGCLTKKILTV